MNYCLKAEKFCTWDLWPLELTLTLKHQLWPRFFSWWVERIQIPQKAKHHLNGVSLADQWCSNIECRLGSFMIFEGGVWTHVPLDPRILNSKASETLVLHVFSLRCARARYILRIKPDDVLGNPGVTHHSSQWVRKAVGTEWVTTHAWVNEDDSMSYSWFKRVQVLKMNKI